MKVVHIGFKYGLNDAGGAAIAATRLHLALLAAGVESHYVTVWKCEDGPNVYELPRGWWRRLFLEATKVLQYCWKFTAYRRLVPLHLVPLFGLEKLLRDINPDVVHVHWIVKDVMSFGQLARLSRILPQARFVVNLHDLYMINALEPYPHEDRRYIEGFNLGNSTRLERWNLHRKCRLVKKLHAKLTFLAPSQWAVDCCRQSIVGRGARVVTVPNLIDSRFVYSEDKCKPHQKFIILYGAYMGRQNWSKGWTDLVAALERLPNDIKAVSELHVFGEAAEDGQTGGVFTRFLGCVTQVEQLVDIYHAADVFAFPSREETQGMTKAEALLCGLPVVAFDRTACAEGVEHAKTGWIAKDDDTAQFAAGVEWAYGLWRRGELRTRRKDIAAAARASYDPDNIISRLPYGR